MSEQKVLERFLKYAAIDSQSGISPNDKPSSLGQMAVISLVKGDLLEGGVHGSQIKEFADGSFLVRFPGNALGLHLCLAAHVDTHPDFPGGAKTTVRTYEGGDIALPKNDVVIPAKDLEGKVGKTIVTADGTTTLGADDKSGVAILVQVALDLAGGVIPNHGPTDLWFCVDEEIGRLDINVVPSDIVASWNLLVTVDGGNPLEMDTDCFSGWETVVEFFGESAHPGLNGKKLKPAHYAMAKLMIVMEGTKPTPWKSDGLEGFVYVGKVDKMTPTHAQATFFPRSFSVDGLKDYHEAITANAKAVAEWYGVKCRVSGNGLMYVGTGKAIDAEPELVQPVADAIEAVTGQKPKEHAARGGTDGAMINIKYPNLPAPNIGTGGYNLHGPKEFLVVEEMEVMYRVVQTIVPRFVKEAKTVP